MKKTLTVLLLLTAVFMLLAPMAFAEEAAAPASKMNYYIMAVLGSCLTITIAVVAAGIAQGLGLSKACEGIARNPGASDKIMTTLVIGLAMIESLAIYALVVVLIILFMNPFKI